MSHVVIDGREYLLTSVPDDQTGCKTLPGLIASPSPTSLKDRCETPPESVAGCQNLKQVLDELRKVRQKQAAMDEKFNEVFFHLNTSCETSKSWSLYKVKLENETLWREIATMRRHHLKQQEIVGRLMKFLIAFANQRARNSTTGAATSVEKGQDEHRLTKRTMLAIGNLVLKIVFL